VPSTSDSRSEILRDVIVSSTPRIHCFIAASFPFQGGQSANGPLRPIVVSG
jgi:hypothetical protein